MIKISIKGIDSTIKNLGKFSKHFSEDVLVDVTESIYKNAHKNIRPHTKTGRLENNLSYRVQKRALTGQVYVSNQGMMTPFKGGTNYAVFVHFGTKPQVIDPKNKKSLRWGNGGKWHFAKKVSHPGYRGDPFMENAARKTMKNIDKIYDMAFKSN